MSYNNVFSFVFMYSILSLGLLATENETFILSDPEIDLNFDISYGATGGMGATGGSGAIDSDGDGCSDDDEISYGTDPYDPYDYPPGGCSGATGATGGTGAIDSDGDGCSDDDEISYGTDPYDPNDYPPGCSGSSGGGSGGSGSGGSGSGGSGSGGSGSGGADGFVSNAISTCGLDPRDIFAIDLDADNDKDILVAYYGDSSIKWLQNDGNEVFNSIYISKNTYGPTAVYAIDLDGDTDIDVLSASEGDNKIAWFENDGNQNFTEHIITTGATQAQDVLAVDLDGDTDIDIVSASFGNDKIVWYKNDGSQNFTPIDISINADGANSVFAIDIDGDNDIDLISSSYEDDKICWYEQGPSLGFTEHIISSSEDGARSVYATDVNSDGHMDVLCVSYLGGEVSWYQNNGLQSFTKNLVGTNKTGAIDVIGVDIDNDNDIDIIGAYELLNDGAIDVFENDGFQTFSIASMPEAHGVKSIFEIDLNENGDIDLLSAGTHSHQNLDYQVIWHKQHFGTTMNPPDYSCPYPSISGRVALMTSINGTGHSNSYAELWKVETNKPYTLIQRTPLLYSTIFNEDEYCFSMVCEDVGDYIIRFIFDPSVDMNALNCYYNKQGNNIYGVPHWTEATVINYNGISIDNQSFQAELNYINFNPTVFQASSGPGARLEVSIEEGNYGPNYRGPSDPIIDVDIGIAKKGGSDNGASVSDNNGKTVIDSLASDDFKIIPEIPGIEVDSALKNININGVDTIKLDIIVDSNIIRLKGQSAASIGGSASTLDSILCQDEMAQLTLTGYLGSIQWQSSPDSINWTDINGETGSSFNTSVNTGVHFYRAAVTNDTNATAFSSIIKLIVNPTFNDSINADICQGESFGFAGQNISTPGTYVDSLSTIEGCDSIVSLFLNVWATSHDTITDSICYGTNYSFAGQNISASGTYIDSNYNTQGCDSNITLELLIHPPPASITLNGPDSVMVNDTSSYYVNGGDSFNWTVSNGNIITNTNQGNIDVVWDSIGYDSVTVIVFDSNSCIMDSASIFIVISDISTNIKTFGSGEMLIYPNPFGSSTTIHINNISKEVFKMKVFDLLGNLKINLENIQDNQIILKNHGLTSGLYFIELKSKLMSLKGRMIVK